MHAATKTIIFAFLIYILTVEARSKDHTHDDSSPVEQHEESIENDELTRPKERSHRRKRNWHYNSYYPSRRYQEPYQDDFYQEQLEQRIMQREILRKLDEILVYVARPPPPPPPPRYVYVRYPVPSRCNCTGRPNAPTNVPNVPSGGVPSRFPDMEDTRMNWGLTDYEYEDQAFNRPLDLVGQERPTVTANPLRPSNNPVTQAPSDPGASDQARCSVALLQCCNMLSRRQSRCITSRNCQVTCSQQSLDAAIDFFSKTYAPRSG